MHARDLILSPQLSAEQVRAFLTGYGFQHPDQSDRQLQQIADRVGDHRLLAGIAGPLLEQAGKTADPDAALLRLERLFERIPNPLGLLGFLQAQPQALEILIQILGTSAHLAQLLLRNPEYFYWLLEEDRLDYVEGRRYFQDHAKEAVLPFDSPELAIDALRRYQRRESLRIATQDIREGSNSATTALQLSYLAESLLKQLFLILAKELLPSPTGFAVLALGKLGGEELNFSSDIDLIYLRGDDTDAQLMARFARTFTQTLGAFTEEGRLYRVDLRLRPMGSAGEIIYSLEAYAAFTETWADTLDRLALLKTRYVAGDPQLGSRFLQSISDFVYKKYLDQGAVEEIRWLKRKIDRELGRRETSNRDIKLGSGGIREIEFFVQTFQLLYGGSTPGIRTPQTLSALDRLLEHEFIEENDHQVLRKAYLFLRDLEHKLQLVEDLQTHELPSLDSELARCAHRLGFRTAPGEEDPVERFRRHLEGHQQGVRRIFETLFETASKRRGLEELVLNPVLSEDEGSAILKTHGIQDPLPILEGIQMLKGATAFPYSPSRLRNLLANLVPHLIVFGRVTPEPNLLFNRLDRFCSSLGSRASLYTELIENPTLRERLLTILSSSDFLSETLIRRPELLDAISTPVPSEADPGALSRLEEQAQIKGEALRDTLRLFKRREEFKLALGDLFEPGQNNSRFALSQLADVCVSHCFQELLKESPELRSERFALLALGKLGGQELTYHSDLDLLLVFESRQSTPLGEGFARLLKSLRHEMEAYTELGQAYRLDFRLRPEGGLSSLAVAFGSLEKYFEERVQPWERLAYVKLRPILSFGSPFPVESLIWKKPFSTSECSELGRIRLRKELEIGKEKVSGCHDFKVGRGGLMDIQFVVQYLQIQHQVRERGTLEAIQTLTQKGHLDQKNSTVLQSALQFLFAVEAMQRLLHERSTNTLSQEGVQSATLARLLGFKSASALLDQYQLVTDSTRQVYRRFFGR